MNEHVQEVTVIDQDQAAVVRRIQERSEAQSLINMIERVALDGSIDIGRLERLIEMQERIMARNAKVAYDAAFAEMQTDLPSIPEHGKGHGSITYALWEDVNDVIKPVLSKHGFGISFRQGRASDKITITAIVSHRDGHSENTTMELPIDGSGSKNAVQAIGSTTSYGKRYTAGLLLNLTSRAPEDRDDDGRAAGGPVSQAQVTELRGLMDSVGADVPKFCRAMEVDGLTQIPAGRFDEAVKRVREYAAKKQQRGAQP